MNLTFGEASQLKLKGHLVGKKRAREQAERDDTKALEEDGGEEESRARAIKKKVKTDPFAKSWKKKGTVTTIQARAPSPKAKGEVTEEVSAKSSSPSCQPTSPIKANNKKSPAPLPLSPVQGKPSGIDVTVSSPRPSNPISGLGKSSLVSSQGTPSQSLTHFLSLTYVHQAMRTRA